MTTGTDSSAAPPATLDLWKAGLRSVPAEIWTRTGLRTLILADNDLASVPSDIARLRNLHTLDLGHNALTRLPEQIGDLTGLTRCLYLHDNRLTELPATLGRLNRLGYLNIGENPLGQLPESLGAMTGLHELRAQHAALTGLPTSLGRLAGLRELWLRGNQLTGLPATVSGLHALRELELRENALPEIPDALRGLPCCAGSTCAATSCTTYRTGWPTCRPWRSWTCAGTPWTTTRRRYERCGNAAASSWREAPGATSGEIELPVTRPEDEPPPLGRREDQRGHLRRTPVAHGDPALDEGDLNVPRPLTARLPRGPRQIQFRPGPARDPLLNHALTHATAPSGPCDPPGSTSRSA